MKTMTRLMLIACLVLPFSACKKEEAAAPVEKAPMSAPTTGDRTAWVEYLNDVVGRNRGKIANEPYVYFLPTEGTDEFMYERLADKTKSDVARGIITGNLLAYASPDSTKMADMVVAAFEGVPANSMDGVKVLFIGAAADGERVKAAVAPSGVDYVFVNTGQ